MRKIINIGCGATLVLLVAVLVTMVIFPPTLGLSATRINRSMACSMSQEFVLARLKSPTTAQFPLWSEENCNVSQRGPVWVVRSYVDAQNSFGATLRNHYTVEMTHNAGTGKWTLLSLDMTSP